MVHSMPAPGPRYRHLSRRLTMFVAGAAIALAGLAAASRPARADAEDILRFLAGAVIIAAIVNAVDDNQSPRYIDRWVLPDSCLETVRVNWRDITVYNARCLNRAGYQNLPNNCLRNFQVNGHGRRGYVAECMWDAGYRRQGNGYYPGPHQPRAEPPVSSPPFNYGHNNRYNVLPSHCEVAYRDNGQRRNGYWGSCLRNSGLRGLPQQCRLNTRGGDDIYNRRCMVNAGYTRER